MHSSEPTEKVNAKAILAIGSALAATAVLLMSVLTWFLVNSRNEYRALLHEQAPILIQDTSITAFYLGNVSFIGLLVLVVFGITVGLRGKRYPDAVNQRVLKVGTVLLLAGIIGVFVGRPIGNWYWADTFRDADYNQCDGSSTITKRWFKVVWTQDPALCSDPEVRRMIASHRYSLSTVNEHVRAHSDEL